MSEIIKEKKLTFMYIYMHCYMKFHLREYFNSFYLIIHIFSVQNFLSILCGEHSNVYLYVINPFITGHFCLDTPHKDSGKTSIVTHCQNMATIDSTILCLYILFYLASL